MPGSAPRASSSRTASKWPFWLAVISGVWPSSLAASTAAPRSNSYRTTSKWPFSLAMNRGVQPSHAAASTAAPRASSSRTTAKWPSRLATRRGVSPPLSAESTAAPRACSSRAVATRPFHAAQDSAVRPSQSFSSTRAPRASSHFNPRHGARLRRVHRILGACAAAHRDPSLWPCTLRNTVAVHVAQKLPAIVSLVHRRAGGAPLLQRAVGEVLYRVKQDLLPPRFPRQREEGPAQNRFAR